MNVTDARETVLDLLAEIAPEVDLDAVPDDEDLRDAVGLDSLDFLTLVEGVHETSGVDVPEMDYDQVRMLSGWVGYLTAPSAWVPSLPPLSGRIPAEGLVITGQIPRRRATREPTN